MLSRVVGLSMSGLLGLRPRPTFEDRTGLQNGPWRSSVLGTNWQAAIPTSSQNIKIVKTTYQSCRGGT
jgi:hypothetical protein